MGSIKTKLDEKAYERDGYKCRECGQTSGIEAHHKIPGMETLDNLITLCHSCHKKEHNMAGCFSGGFDKRRKYKLSICQVKQIKQMLHENIPKRKIGKIFGVDHKNICDIESKKSWAWVN